MSIGEPDAAVGRRLTEAEILELMAAKTGARGDAVRVEADELGALVLRVTGRIDRRRPHDQKG